MDFTTQVSEYIEKPLLKSIPMHWHRNRHTNDWNRIKIFKYIDISPYEKMYKSKVKF